MIQISNEFIVGTLIGYFLQNYFIIFILGIFSGIVIVEKYGLISNIGKLSLKNTNEFVRELFTTYIKGKPFKTENNELVKELSENKLD
jgi:hypothetical protein